MKRIVCAILSIVIIMSLFAACTADKKQEKKKDEKSNTLYFKDSTKSKKAVATFFNSKSGKKKDVKMKKISEDKDSFTFSCKGDCTLYNMAYVTYGKEKTEEFAFNKCTSGWYKTEDDIMPFTYGDEINYSPKFDDVTLNGYGYEKSVHIWKPDDYDKNSDEKYSTIYLLDGQGMVFLGRDDQELHGCPVATEQVKAMTSVTGTKAIVVAIENVFARDYELVPEIGTSMDEKRMGEVKYDSMNGTEFADFVANTLTPYVQKHYNVYKDALHTSVAGYSLGGLEAFYITMEYPNVFGTVGALSPSFWEYDNATWNKYLGKKKFSSKSPFIYLYTGVKKFDTYTETNDMYNRLRKMGYPKDKLLMHYNEKGAHDSAFWRNIFSEFLTAMVYRRVEPLQK